ncbi:TraR/DksA family transcriptional regulator [Tundrisphaera sp. TA3]|uniref:TraR/DksA family transcriptional regulator n=1 Tax=Tundrisphaera sp. TA3 TaxID=3435775 RepID=UPI003EC08A4E
MSISEKKMQQLRRVLEAMDGRLVDDVASLEEEARVGVGGEAGGNLSGTPMHLADLGTEQYMQELNATLLENEEYIRQEVRDALGRLDRNAYGTCERCGKTIMAERLEAIPYTRYCTPCSAEVGAGAAANLNDGRPESMGGLDRRHGAGNLTDTGDRDQPFTDDAPRSGDREDIHAAGTAGGGTAIGGLAGTNIGEGDPDDGDLEEAMGSGNYDQELDDDHEDTSAYSGASGGAVGGAVADLRSTGGKTGGGIAPQPEPGDSPVGQ